MTTSIKYVMICLAAWIMTTSPLNAMEQSVEVGQIDHQEEIDINDAKTSNLVVINQNTGITSCGTIEQKILELNMQINMLKQTPLEKLPPQDQKRRIIKDLEDIVELLKKTLYLGATIVIFIEGRRILVKLCEMGCLAYDIWLKSQNFNHSMAKTERLFAFFKSVAEPVIEFFMGGFTKKLKFDGIFTQTPENSLLKF